VSEPALQPSLEGAENAGPPIRTVRKDGREVVTMRCAQDGDGWMVECEVYPVGAVRVEPLRPGPYRFDSLAQAETFVHEAELALTYLGCEVV
jgi:hypothetical protein